MQQVHTTPNFMQPAVLSSSHESTTQMLNRSRHSEINVLFVFVFAIMGAALAVANAFPNGEYEEIGIAAVFVVVMLVPYGLNRFGLLTAATIVLWLVPLFALIVDFTQPLPSGTDSLTWTYDAGIGLLGLSALLVTLVCRWWLGWSLVLVSLIVVWLCIAHMPLAPSLPGLDIEAGIISSHWPLPFQYGYAVYDFLFRPFLLTILLAGVGARLRRMLFSSK